MDRTVIAPPGSSLILHLIKYSSLNYGEYNWTWMGFSVKQMNLNTCSNTKRLLVNVGSWSFYNGQFYYGLDG